MPHSRFDLRYALCQKLADAVAALAPFAEPDMNIRNLKPDFSSLLALYKAFWSKMVIPSALSPQAYARAFRELREWVELGGDYRWHPGDLSEFPHTTENLGPPSEEAGAGGYVAASLSPLARLNRLKELGHSEFRTHWRSALRSPQGLRGTHICMCADSGANVYTKKDSGNVFTSFARLKEHDEFFSPWPNLRVHPYLTGATWSTWDEHIAKYVNDHQNQLGDYGERHLQLPSTHVLILVDNLNWQLDKSDKFRGMMSDQEYMHYLNVRKNAKFFQKKVCLLYTSPSPRD